MPVAKPYSQQFISLKDNIEKLKQILLPQISISGNYTPEELIKIRTFRVMAHAELEYYFEKRCEAVIDASKISANAKKRPRIVSQLKEYFSTKDKSFFTWSDTDANLFKQYMQTINKNHGIKESNIYKMLKPLGFHSGNVDQILVATLSSYGDVRGRFAHNSIGQTISSPAGTAFVFDSSIEINEIDQILRGITKLDRKFDALLT